MSTRDELAEAMAELLFDRGQRVQDWPDDEKALQRDSDQWEDFADRADKVRRLQFEKAADVLLATGWSKPRTVGSIEELDTLPVGSMVINASHATMSPEIWQKVEPWKQDPRVWYDASIYDSEIRNSAAELVKWHLPLTVLFIPGGAS